MSGLSKRIASAAAVGLQLALLPAAHAQGQGAAGAVPAGSIVQMVLGLAAVLGLVALCAWALRRFSGLPGTGPGIIRIVGGAAVGQRERVVLVEVGGTWLVLGVAPGQVRTLHTMPRAESSAPAGAPGAAEAGFAGWLRKMTESRQA
jgi:flagellar protein FliO/FliZ